MLLVIGCFVGGWLGRQLVPRPVALATLFDRYVLSIALPALILVKLPGLALGSSVAVPMAIAWVGIAVAIAVVQVASRIWHWDRNTTGALMLVTPLGNTSFLGLAAVEALLGRKYLGQALAFDQLGSFLGVAAYGSLIAGRYGTGEGGLRPALVRLIKFPPFIALLASIALRWIDLPSWTHTGLSGLGRTVAPVAIVALGLRFRLVFRRRVVTPAAVCLLTKMALLPLGAFAIAAVAGVSGDPAWQASILQLSMPPMVTAGVVATQAGLDEELSTLVVGLGILIAFVTAPLLALAL